MRHTLKFLLQQGLITEEGSSKLDDLEANKPMSIHWHVRVILYLGVSLLTAGLGTIIYENIDSIGHITIVSVIGAISGAALFYCFKKAPPFATEKTEFANSWLDYVLLLGVTTFLIFEGYLQFQFEIFGTHYGLAIILPAIVLFVIAYYFDHLGVLVMAITLFASWLGISLTPKELLVANNFSDQHLIFTGMLLSGLLFTSGYLHTRYHFKEHFTFSYYNFALHLGAMATFGAVFTLPYGLLWLGLLIPIVWLGYKYALQEKSFYFLLFISLYTYAGMSYLLTKVLLQLDDAFTLSFYLLLIYFIASALYLLKFLRDFHKKMTAL